MANRLPKSSPGVYAGEDNGWVGSLFARVIREFDASITKYPSLKRVPAGSDLKPNLRDPENPVPALNPAKPRGTTGANK
ncbi:MAG TPA: hypothetical protein VMM54_09245 [Nitrospirota bacterium]|nr:hypothetical protein [Nitrospirota bacterium]